jgi:hypothetical protein
VTLRVNKKIGRVNWSYRYVSAAIDFCSVLRQTIKGQSGLLLDEVLVLKEPGRVYHDIRVITRNNIFFIR